jgi:hypothetical protein
VKECLLNTFGTCADSDGGAKRDADRGFRITSIYVNYQVGDVFLLFILF